MASISVEILKKLTILYVEDEDTIRKQASNVLKKLCKEVYLAEDGQKGIDTFLKYQDTIDIIISDINMPHMDGLEMCSNIKEIDSKIPIIITTAHTEENYMMKSMDLKVDKYIKKPLKMAELAKAIQDITSNHKKEQKLRENTSKLVTKSAEVLRAQIKLKADNVTNKDEIKRLSHINDQYISYFKTDKINHITDVSSKLLKLYGYKKENLVGREAAILLGENSNSSQLQKHLLETIRTKEFKSYEYEFKAIDGKYITCDMVVVPNYDEDMMVNGYTFYQDILDISY